MNPAHKPLRRLVLWALLAALLVGFLALGTWQVQRRAWKLALIDRVEQRVHSPPVALPPPSAWTAVSAASDEYRPVTVQGQWLPERTVLSQATTELGAGFWVLTPLRQADGSLVWVNRGFVPESERAALPAPAAGPACVTGLLRMNEPGGGFLRRNDPAAGRWHSRDVVAMAQAAHLAPASPFFIDAGLPGAAPDTGWPRAGLTVIRFHNSHLVYALTWYGLAAMVLVAAGLLWRQPATVGGGTPQPAP